LLFFYVTALAVLIGAEVNSAIDHVRPVASTLEGRRRSRGPVTVGPAAVGPAVVGPVISAAEGAD
jgi:hypothetical protein